VGHFEAVDFRPGEWRPEYPNPAFERCDSTDAFWAARQIAAVTPDELRVIVETARFSNPETVDYLVSTLRTRQKAIASTYLSHGGGIDRFNVKGQTLHFDDLLAQHGIAPAGVARKVTWHVFDNATEEVTRPLASVETDRESIRLPDASPPFLRVRIQTPGRGTTFVYLRRTRGDAYDVVGRDFESPGPVQTARAGD